MSFKVKDLTLNVGPLQNEQYTCTLVTRPTGGICVDTALDYAGKAANGLALLKAQLRRSATRA